MITSAVAGLIALLGGMVMTPPLDFSTRQRMAVVTRQRLAQRARPLGNKLQEIATRSPRDVQAFEELADFVLARLDMIDARKERNR